MSEYIKLVSKVLNWRMAKTSWELLIICHEHQSVFRHVSFSSQPPGMQFIRRLHTEGARVGWKTELKGERCCSYMTLLAFDIFNHSFNYKLVPHHACLQYRVISDHVSSWERRRAGLLPQPHPHFTLFNPRPPRQQGWQRGTAVKEEESCNSSCCGRSCLLFYCATYNTARLCEK